jgi:hypothetical protein
MGAMLEENGFKSNPMTREITGKIVVSRAEEWAAGG